MTRLRVVLVLAALAAAWAAAPPRLRLQAVQFVMKLASQLTGRKRIGPSSASATDRSGDDGDASAAGQVDASKAPSQTSSGEHELVEEPALTLLGVADLLALAEQRAIRTTATAAVAAPAHRHAHAAATGLALLAELEPLGRGWRSASDADVPATSAVSSAAAAAAAATAFATAAAAAATTATSGSGVRISTLTLPDLALPFVRGDGILFGSHTLQEALSVVRSGAARKLWDPRFDSAHVIEYLSTSDFVMYSVQKGTFPVAARDLVTVSSVAWAGAHKMVYNSVSVRDPGAPADGVAGRVRAAVMVAGWILEKSDFGVKAAYIVHVDPKGTVPTSLMKLVQVQTPTCIANVAKYLETKGPLPFLFRDDRLGPSADVVLLREELVDGSVHLEYTTTIPASHTPTPRAVTESVAAAAAAAAASAASAVTAPVARAAAAGGAAASTPAGRPRAMLPQPAGVKFGRIVVALPTQSFILGAAASMSAYVAATPAGPRTSADLQPDAALCGARKVAADELRGLVSTSTAHAIEFWVSSAAPAGATIHVEIMIDMHSGGVLFNGARLA